MNRVDWFGWHGKLLPQFGTLMNKCFRYVFALSVFNIMWITALPRVCPWISVFCVNKVIRGGGSSLCAKLYINVPSLNLEISWSFSMISYLNNRLVCSLYVLLHISYYICLSHTMVPNIPLMPTIHRFIILMPSYCVLIWKSKLLLCFFLYKCSNGFSQVDLRVFAI